VMNAHGITEGGLSGSAARRSLIEFSRAFKKAK
jgi:hypothetical protein